VRAKCACVPPTVSVYGRHRPPQLTRWTTGASGHCAARPTHDAAAGGPITPPHRARARPPSPHFPSAALTRACRLPAQCTSLLDPPRASFSPKSLVNARSKRALSRTLRSAPRCWIHNEPDSDSNCWFRTCTTPRERLCGAFFSSCKTCFFCILLQSSILHRLFGCIRSVSGSASYGVQGHSVNARMQMYANTHHARASSSFLSTRSFCDFCTLALGHPCRVALLGFENCTTQLQPQYRCEWS